MEIGVKDFFNRDPEDVAKDLLGMVICREIDGNVLRARIVETEAYYDGNDPASRARQNGNLRDVMFGDEGVILVYGVHNTWLLNLVTGEKGEGGAVLIRAVEPIDFNAKTSGPGLLTRALKIDKSFHEKHIRKNKSLWLENTGSYKNFYICESKRVGVSKDLDKNLRFFIKDNEFVSKK